MFGPTIKKKEVLFSVLLWLKSKFHLPPALKCLCKRLANGALCASNVTAPLDGRAILRQCREAVAHAHARQGGCTLEVKGSNYKGPRGRIDHKARANSVRSASRREGEANVHGRCRWR